MWKRIGILGGMSPESTLLYYQRLTRGYFERRGDHHFPEIVVFSVDFARFTELEHADDLGPYVDEIVAGVRLLEAADAELVALAANSPHAVFDAVAERVGVRLVSIVEATASEAARRGLERALLLGIDFTMTGSFYPQACARHGVDIITPDAEQRRTVDRAIFEELAAGIVRPETKRGLLSIIGAHEVDGVILGCTELPLLIGGDDLSIPVLDTAAIHVDAILDLALGDGGAAGPDPGSGRGGETT